MEAGHKPGNLCCDDVRDLLSDIIDARRGELPHPDATRLAVPGMRASVELHLVACENCREELSILEEVGSAFRDFSVGEPPVQHFAEYGARIRARLAAEEPAAMSCSEAAPLLSDLLDLQRGESLSEVSAIASLARRASLEKHLSSCAACREELLALEEIGAAYADFSVGEPSAQHFANYGKVVRERMARTEAGVISGAYALRTGSAEKVEKIEFQRPRRARNIFAFAASTVAAASLVLALSNHLRPAKQESSRESKKKVAAAKAAGGARSAPHSLPLMRVFTPVGQQHQEFTHNPDDPGVLQTLKKQEAQFRYIIIGEKTAENEKPLLGVYVKTTRDVDRDINEKLGLMVYYVVPGSPADRMGLKPNDFITDINGTAVNDGGAEEAMKFFTQIRNEGYGKKFSLQLLRPTGQTHLYMLKNGKLGVYEVPGLIESEEEQAAE